MPSGMRTTTNVPRVSGPLTLTRVCPRRSPFAGRYRSRSRLPICAGLEGRSPGHPSLPPDYLASALTATVSRDTWRELVRFLITPRPPSRLMSVVADLSNSPACFASLAATAARNFLTAVRIADLWAALRAWCVMRCRFFFCADLMLAIWKGSHSA